MRTAPHGLVIRILCFVLSFVFLFNPMGVSVARALTTTVNDGPVFAPITDLSCGAPLTRNIAVAANVVISDINVGVNLNHTRRSDVRVTLTSPAGTTVVLISGGGLGAPTIASPDDYDNYDIMLDDTAVGSIYDNSNDSVGFPYYDRQTAPPGTSARPYELLSAFKGQNSAGTWVLRICDTSAGQTGFYNRAQLVITSANPNTVSGNVFTDYNDNGVRGAGDTAVAGITVTAYDATGAVVASAVTNASGGYTLAIPNGTQVRIEFTGIPAALRPGAFGRDSGTTVQFVTSPSAGVDLGLSKPDEY